MDAKIKLLIETGHLYGSGRVRERREMIRIAVKFKEISPVPYSESLNVLVFLTSTLHIQSLYYYFSHTLSHFFIIPTYFIPNFKVHWNDKGDLRPCSNFFVQTMEETASRTRGKLYSSHLFANYLKYNIHS